MLKNIDIGTKIHEIAWTTMNNFLDSVIVEKIDSNSLKVSLSDWNRWYWYNNLGASDYENENCIVNFQDDSHTYIVKFKNLTPLDAVIYLTPGGWKSVNWLSKKGNAS